MRRDTVSARDDFFATGGNSLIAVGLVNRLNREFGTTLPLQVLFESPTIELLARRVIGTDAAPASRLLPLRAGAGRPVFGWPGLGGYPMNLRLLAGLAGGDRPFYGVQAHGLNDGEVPYPTIREMAAADVDAIRRVQPHGPYTLWGYSFGARVAFETAYQLEQAGDRVDDLLLIAPGSPRVASDGAPDRVASYHDQTYITILFSVFAGTITGPLLEECLAAAHDEDSFATFIDARFPELGPDLIRRIIRVVGTTFTFTYTFDELNERRIAAPVTVLKATGDDYSFLEGAGGWSAAAPVVVDLAADHYTMLREAGIDELATAIHRRPQPRKDPVMPHVNIKHFPVPLSAEQQSRLVTAVTEAMTRAFGCDEGAVSIALEPVEEEVWRDRVYIPEIVNRREILGKVPTYSMDAR